MTKAQETALNAELLAALILCERALEERDAEAEEHAAKAARAAIAKAKGANMANAEQLTVTVPNYDAAYGDRYPGGIVPGVYGVVTLLRRQLLRPRRRSIYRRHARGVNMRNVLNSLKPLAIVTGQAVLMGAAGAVLFVWLNVVFGG